MDNFEHLTNESIRQKFKSQFELVNYSIKLAAQLITSGRAPRVDIDNQNPAVIIIEEIVEGEDQYDDVSSDSEKKSQPIIEAKKMESPPPMAAKPPEKKKARRILA